jgi:hypothetical protein
MAGSTPAKMDAAKNERLKLDPTLQVWKQKGYRYLPCLKSQASKLYRKYKKREEIGVGEVARQSCPSTHRSRTSYLS